MPVIRMSDPEHFAHRPRPDAQALKAYRIGDRLKTKILRRTANGVPCSDCQSEINRLNTMTPEEVLAEVDELTERIVTRAKTKAHRWYERAAAKYLPGMVAAEIRSWIIESCEEASRPS